MHSPCAEFDWWRFLRLQATAHRMVAFLDEGIGDAQRH